MASVNEERIAFPDLPAKYEDFVQYITANVDVPVRALLEPYQQYDSQLRKAFAQQPNHPAVCQPNVFSLFEGHEKNIRIRARDLNTENDSTKESYIMPLRPDDRKSNGGPAIVESLSKFKEQFALFSESSLSDMDWSNIVIAGSSVVTSLMPVPDKYGQSKRALRQYYHEILAPASDVDIFIFGLTEEQAIEKIKLIERNIKDALLVECTVVRTKNAITIASQYPVRHVQIVLRIYKSISEILTGFDVDCSCVAYDGQKVWTNPRGLAAFMTQINTIDITRRSPSYEQRLSKYRGRGFEVFWAGLDRSRIDPTIFERSFLRTQGLARLLIMEKLPTNAAREDYLNQRRRERNRPQVNRSRRRARKLMGDIKAEHQEEVPDWSFDFEEDVSNYHTFTIPYGEKYHAAKIERLLYTKDMLLNAEWNQKDRKVNLHRHPAFFGTVEDVVQDCCGFCPAPNSMEEEEIQEVEGKIYVSGAIQFIRDDAGHQTIGSFHPLSADDYTEMAYVGNTAMLNQAIIDGDSAYIESWLKQDGNDINTRDYTGRTPLHLAVMHSTADITQLLIDNGARMSAANEEEEAQKIEAKRRAHQAKTGQAGGTADPALQDADIDMLDDESDTDLGSTTDNSLVDLKFLALEPEKSIERDDEQQEPDILDVNIVAWDNAVAPLHLAIVSGHVDAVKCLVQEFGADVLLPIKLNDQYQHDKQALLTLVLAMSMPKDKAIEMTQVLLELGATCSQADTTNVTALHVAAYQYPTMLDTYQSCDPNGVKRAINHFAARGRWHQQSISNALMAALANRDALTALKVLSYGAKPGYNLSTFTKVTRHLVRDMPPNWSNRTKEIYEKEIYEQSQQPIVLAVANELPSVAVHLVELGVDPNTYHPDGLQVLRVWNEWRRNSQKGLTILDMVVAKIEELRAWTPQSAAKEPPLPLESDEFYLDGFAPGSYQMWTAQNALQQARKAYEQRLKSHVEDLKRQREQKGVEEKQAAVADLLDAYLRLQASLEKHGGKTFHELHQNIPIPDPPKQTQGLFGGHQAEPKAFEVKFTFVHKVMTEEISARYVEMYKAAWIGDIEGVKRHALLPWTDADGQQQEPLQIAMQDANFLSPFAIALQRGHYELADLCLEIAIAQYSPVASDTRVHTRLRGQGDDSVDGDSDAEDSEIGVEEEEVGDVYTIENVGEVTMTTTTTISPTMMMEWSSDSYEALNDSRSHVSDVASNKRTNTGSNKALKEMVAGPHLLESFVPAPKTLVQVALWNDDSRMLTYLLEAMRKYRASSDATDGSNDYARRSKPMQHSEDFDYAIRLDRPHLLALLMRLRGDGLPLPEFLNLEKAISNQPTTYQGLNVHGKKKREWALRGRGEGRYTMTANERPPLLMAARYGAVATYKWLESDDPLQCYREYANNEIDVQDLADLQTQKGGFDKLVQGFMGMRKELSIHCCVLAAAQPHPEDLMQHILTDMAESIDHKSQDGTTALSLAFRNRRHDLAKLLIDHGANQTARNLRGENILHAVLSKCHHGNDQEVHSLRKMIELIDKRVLHSLFVERCAAVADTRTPLAQWLATSQPNKPFQINVCKLLLKYSHGAELDLVDGLGETPLHIAIRKHDFGLTKVLIDFSPEPIHRENAAGVTGFEFSEAAMIREKVSSAVQVPIDHGPYYHAVHFSNTNMIQRPFESFVKADDKPQSRNDGDVWTLMKETHAALVSEGRAKRKLVTLNEAVEVARRLAAKCAMRQAVSTVAENKTRKQAFAILTGPDEVEAWRDNAIGSWKESWRQLIV